MATITTPTQSPHADAAKSVIDKLRVLRTEIPNLVEEAPRDSRRLSLKAGIPDGFIESAGAIVQISKRLESAAEMDAITLRDSHAYSNSYRALLSELRALTRAVAHAIRTQRAAAAESALDIYAIAQRLSLRPDGADLRPYVEEMSRKLNRGGKKKKKGADPDSASDATTTTPAPAEAVVDAAKK